MADGVKVTIDRDECISCAICWTTCPEFFEPNPDDDRSQVVAGHRVKDDPAQGVAPPELLDAIREAADGCPVEIIHVLE